MSKTKIKNIFISLLFLTITSVYFFPLKNKGLIILPLDILQSSFHPWYAPGEILLKNPYMQDSIAQIYPWRHFLYQSLSKGILPLWNPYQLMGSPFIANMKAMAFYPLNILFIFGEVNSWNLLLFFQVFLSLLFFYAFSRSLKIGAAASILAGISFALNSLMMGYLEFGSEGHVLLWAPLMLLFTKKYLDNKESKNLFMLAIAVLLSILAGHLQDTTYLLIITLAFAVYYAKFNHSKIKNLINIIIAIGLGILASSIQLIPSLELFSQSSRATNIAKDMFYSGLLPAKAFLRLLSPDYFGNPVTRDLKIGYIETGAYFGIIPLFFALFSIIYSVKKPIINFFSFVFVFSAMFSTNVFGPIIYYLHIPVVTSGSGGRLFFLTIFSGVVLAGIGIDSYFKSEKNKGHSKATIISFIIIASAYFLTFFSKVPTLNYKFPLFIFIASVITLAIKKALGQSMPSGVVKIFLIILTFMDLFRVGYRFLTYSNIKFFYPKTEATLFIENKTKDDLGRFYGLISPEIPTAIGLYSIETYNPFYIYKSSKLIREMQTIKNTEANKVLITTGEKDARKLFSFLGVKYILTTKDANPSINYLGTKDHQLDFEVIHKDDRYYVFENLSSFPRFGLYYDYVYVPNENEALAALSNNETNLAKKIILEDEPGIEKGTGSGSASLKEASVNNLVFSASSDKPAIFYLSDTYFPGWKAKVNNQPARILKANYNFRAIIIPKGNSSIELYYQPKSFIIGTIISGGSLLLLLLFCAFARRRFRKTVLPKVCSKKN